MEQALLAKLLASSGLTALVQTRVRWNQRPQADALPAVSLSVPYAQPLYTDEGPVGLTDVMVQIDCWARDAEGVNGATTAIEVAQAVRSALQHVAMTERIEFQGVFLDGIRDVPPEEAVGGVLIYRRILEYNLWPTG